MASILQNLPSTGANPARSAGRNLAKAFDHSEKSQSFEQALDRSSRRDVEAAEANRAKPADRPERVDRSAESKEKTEPVEETNTTERPEDSAQTKVRAKSKKSDKPADEQPEDSAAPASDAQGQTAKPAAEDSDATGFELTQELFANIIQAETKPVVTGENESATPIPTDLNLTSTIAIDEVAAAQALIKPVVTETTAAEVDSERDAATAAIDPFAQLPKAKQPSIPQNAEVAKAGTDDATGAPVDAELQGVELDPTLVDETPPPEPEFDPVAAAKPQLETKPHKSESVDAAGDDAIKSALSAAPSPVEATPTAPAQPTAHALEAIAPTTPQPAHSMKAEAVQAARAIEPAQKFIEDNHPQIVSGVRGQLLPNGGTMQIRLDPPELGALMVQVTMRDGLMDASFQTSNAEASQMLSHSLTQLKHSLESAGVNVDRITVAQAPRSESSNNSQNDRNNNQQQQGQGQMDWNRHSDQQRKEMLKRMWAKLGVGDPLDVVA